MILPVGVGFQSPGPTGAVGFTITTGIPCAGRLDGFEFGQKLRALVVADHLIESRVRLFVGQRCAVTRHGDRRHGAGVDNALDAALRRDFKKPARAFDVALVNLLGIARPQAVVGGHVKDPAHALHRAIERRRRRADRLRRARRPAHRAPADCSRDARARERNVRRRRSCRATWLPTKPWRPSQAWS